MEDALMVICGVILVIGAPTPVAGARNAVIAVLISYVFSFLVSVGWYLATGGKFVNPKKQLKPLIASSAPITAMRTSASLLNSAVAFILSALLIAGGATSSEAMSLFGIAVGMAVPILFIPSSAIGSIAVVVAPELSENYYRGNADALKHDVEKTVNSAILIGTVIVPVLFALGMPVSQFLYSSELCGDIVTYSSFIVLPMCISMMTNTVLNSINCEKSTLIYFIIGAAATLICIVALTPFIGVYSYVCGLACSNIISAVLNLRLLKKKCGKLSVSKYALKSLIAVLAASVFGWLLEGIFKRLVAPIFQILICGPIILLFLVAAAYLMKMFTFRPLKRLISKS